MDIRKIFTPQEWELLGSSPVYVSAGVMSSDKSGPLGSMKELKALSRKLLETSASDQKNPLVELVSVHPLTDEDNQRALSRGWEDLVHGSFFQTVEQMASLVEQKTPTYAAEFKRFLYDTAFEVAMASNEGFLDLFGDKISRQEADFLNQLNLSLRLG